jgi:hypothetical protein
MLEHKPHQAVAEPANTVVEKNWIGGVCHGGLGVRMCRIL